MSSLLLIHGALALIALARGWRVAPLVLVVAPFAFAKYGPGVVSEMSLAGWVLPFANLLVAVAGLSTLSLLYTAVADPEPA
jgi:hypothetical protein